MQAIGPMCDNCSVSKLFAGSLAGKKHKMFPTNSNDLRWLQRVIIYYIVCASVSYVLNAIFAFTFTPSQDSQTYDL